jgi:hypothetical protein
MSEYLTELQRIFTGIQSAGGGAILKLSKEGKIDVGAKDGPMGAERLAVKKAGGKDSPFDFHKISSTLHSMFEGAQTVFGGDASKLEELEKLEREFFKLIDKRCDNVFNKVTQPESNIPDSVKKILAETRQFAKSIKEEKKSHYLEQLADLTAEAIHLFHSQPKEMEEWLKPRLQLLQLTFQNASSSVIQLIQEVQKAANQFKNESNKTRCLEILSTIVTSSDKDSCDKLKKEIEFFNFRADRIIFFDADEKTAWLESRVLFSLHLFDPHTPEEVRKLLQQADKLRSALRNGSDETRFLKFVTGYTDPSRRAHCQELQTKFEELLNESQSKLAKSKLAENPPYDEKKWLAQWLEPRVILTMDLFDPDTPDEVRKLIREGITIGDKIADESQKTLFLSSLAGNHDALMEQKRIREAHAYRDSTPKLKGSKLEGDGILLMPSINLPKIEFTDRVGRLKYFIEACKRLESMQDAGKIESVWGSHLQSWSKGVCASISARVAKKAHELAHLPEKEFEAKMAKFCEEFEKGADTETTVDQVAYNALNTSSWLDGLAAVRDKTPEHDRGNFWLVMNMLSNHVLTYGRAEYADWLKREGFSEEEREAYHNFDFLNDPHIAKLSRDYALARIKKQDSTEARKLWIEAVTQAIHEKSELINVDPHAVADRLEYLIDDLRSIHGSKFQKEELAAPLTPPLLHAKKEPKPAGKVSRRVSVVFKNLNQQWSREINLRAVSSILIQTLVPRRVTIEEEGDEAALKKWMTLPQGVYGLSFDISGLIGGRFGFGRHATMLIKQEGQTYVFDPDIGFIKCDKDNPILTIQKAVLNTYSPRKEKDIVDHELSFTQWVSPT